MSARERGAATLLLQQRRRVFMALLATLAAGGLPLASLAALQGDDPAAALDPAMLTDLRAAEPLGLAYLAAYPEEADPEWLGRQLVAVMLARAPGAPAGAGEIFERFDRAVRAEYAEGAVVLVDGWLLSRSEARLYALSVLQRRQ